MSENKIVRGRFAPSPSGRMHLGNLCCALLAWLSVRSQNGEMVLRIEDLDPDRCKRTYAEQLCDDLLWLGLDWDEGPGKDGGHGPYFQSERRHLFEDALQQLMAQGLVYPCFCTRAQLHAASAPHAGETTFRYTGTCRGLTPEEIAEKALVRSPAMRFRAPEGVISFDDLFLGPQSYDVQTMFGDFLIRRSDGVHAYQLAVTVDDALMGITEVVRGSDLLTSTGCQIQLFRALGAESPRYGHIPLLVNPEGRRLSKRERDLDIGALRARLTPEQLCGHLAHLLGMLPSPEPLPAREMIPLYKTTDLSRATIIVPEDFAQ
ncbi:MAG: tRNA glutamyl-Q(34) synthetase GluQRS [Clostridia bacterium]|nr:tRNA glutamyl-Q(34) synthetase GluQRS [Clostridia bacterium]